MKNRCRSMCGACAFLLGLTPVFAHALSTDDVLGTWKIVSFIQSDPATGSKLRPLGDHPNGYLIVRPHHLAMMLVSDGRKPAGNDAETARLMQSMIAYSGSYTIHPDPLDPDGLKFSVHIEVSGDPSSTGTDHARYAALYGNRLSIRSQPGPHASMLIFERANTKPPAVVLQPEPISR